MLFLAMLFLDVTNLVHLDVPVIAYLILLCADTILGEFIYRVLERNKPECDCEEED